MKKLYFIILLFCGLNAAAQPNPQIRPTLNESSIVKDSTGYQYPHIIWQKLFQSGQYGMRWEQNRGSDTEFLLYELSGEERRKRMESLPMPRETSFFKSGTKLGNFRFTDLEGHRYNLKEMAGKVIVLNFWFVKCAPCRIEIPELNKMVTKYQDNPNVVFLAIGLDSESEINAFTKKVPFKYHITDNGRYLATSYRVSTYPSHVVIDQSGKILFHTTGFAQNTVYWIDKTVELALKQAQLPD